MEKEVVMIIEIWNDQYSFSEKIRDYTDSSIPNSFFGKIELIPKDHYLIGWVECLIQSDNGPLWEPTHIKLIYERKSKIDM